MREEPIKVLLINTSEATGGAAIAARRLLVALNKQGVKAKLFVKEKQSHSENVVTKEAKLRYALSFLWERFVIWVAAGFKRSKVFQVDLANAGVDITREKAFQEADIIHLHWINQGLFSLHQLGQIITSGKPVVWTLHDMWPITGICHHARECIQYQSYCVKCPYLAFPFLRRDLSYRVFNRKKKLYLPYALTFVGCSKWIAHEAQKSALTKNQKVFSIPNPIPTTIYRPKDQTLSRKKMDLPLDKKLLLFGAMNVSDRRKGFEPFVKACYELREKGYTQEELGIVVMGHHAEELKAVSPFPVYPMGYMDATEQIVAVYNAVDLYVTSSLEENLPNMVMEAMACGVPCVGFDVGGIPEMIDHQENGYVAVYGDEVDLAAGMQWVLQESGEQDLGNKARKKAVNSYSEEFVTSSYMELYEILLNSNES